jgi:hypothetical protein
LDLPRTQWPHLWRLERPIVCPPSPPLPSIYLSRFPLRSQFQCQLDANLLIQPLDQTGQPRDSWHLPLGRLARHWRRLCWELCW